MLHPALAQALVTAHLDDLQRAAARRHAIRLVSICRRRPRGAASGIDRASSEARRASSVMAEEAPMSTCVPAADRRPRRRLHARLRPRARARARRDGPGAVSTTGHSHDETTWSMVVHRSDGVRSARVTRDLTAGAVAVDVVSSDDHATSPPTSANDASDVCGEEEIRWRTTTSAMTTNTVS
jgi:hypothetical protein